METNEGMDRKVKEGDTLDVSFSHDGKTMEAKGHVKDVSDDAMVIKLDINDKNITLPDGAEIFIDRGGILYSIADSEHFPEVKVVKLAQRGHVRVDDVLKVDYKKISHKDYEKYKDVPRVIFQNIFEESVKVPKIEDITLNVLYELVYHLNLKVDRILDIVSREVPRKYDSSIEHVNISGSGLRFVSDHNYQIGDLIAMRVDLAATTPVHVLSEVVSSEESGNGNYVLKVKFVELSGGDQEKIIKHIFARQREILRNKRTEEF